MQKLNGEFKGKETQDYNPSSILIPSSRAKWSFNASNKALLLHDLQTYYLNGIGPTVKSSILSNINKIIRFAVEFNIPIFASEVYCTKNKLDRGLMYDLWDIGPNLENDNLSLELDVTENEIRKVFKRSYSAFFSTDLLTSLSRLNCDSLILVGLYARTGCYITSVDAFMRDIKVFFVADAVGDFTREEHEQALSMVGQTSGKVISTNDILKCKSRDLI